MSIGAVAIAASAKCLNCSDGSGRGSAPINGTQTGDAVTYAWAIVLTSSSVGAFFGTLCDVILCGVVYRTCRAHGVKPCDVYVISVALANLLLSAVYLPCVVAGNVQQRDIFGTVGCEFLAWLQSTAVGVILLSHAALAVHWMALTYSTDMGLLRRRGVVASLGVAIGCWLTMGAACSASSRSVSFAYDVNYHCSHGGFDKIMLVPMSIGLIPSLLLTPLSYAITFVRLIRYRAALGGGGGGVNSSGEAPSLLTAGERRERNLLKTTLVTFLAFECLYAGSVILPLASRDPPVLTAGYAMLYATCLVNGPLVLAMNRDYRRLLVRTLKWTPD